MTEKTRRRKADVEGAVYDSREPLENCEFPSLGRQVGVLVYDKRVHAETGVELVDVSYEVPTLNTATYGARPVEARWKDEAHCQTLTIVKKLDKMIEELLVHRKRLLAEAKKLQGS